jgi:general secretion pathway protein A
LPFFTLPALWLTYRMTRGYPRKVIHICHRVLLTLIIQGKTRITWNMVRSAGRSVREGQGGAGVRRTFWKVALTMGVLVMVGIWVGHVRGLVSVDFLNRFMGVAHAPASRVAVTPRAVPMPNATNASAFDAPAGETRRFDSVGSAQEEDEVSLAVAPSPLLGVIGVRYGDVMYRFIRGVYTPSSQSDLQDRLQVVLKSNPGLNNRPGRLLVGTKVVFPAPDPVHDPFGRGQYWLMLASRSELEPMFRLYEEYRKTTCMVIHWNRDKGYSFSLMHAQGFVAKDEALEAVGSHQLGFEPVVIDRSTWAYDVFFTPLPGLGDDSRQTVGFSTESHTARHIETARISG